MSDGMMQELVDKIRKQYHTLTNNKSLSSNYVFIVKNGEMLIDIGRTTSNIDAALTGEITDEKHPKSGIAMMAAAYNKTRNNIYYIHSTKTKSAEVERELKQIEKTIKNIALEHYRISDKKAGSTYCSGTIKENEVAALLQKFLYDNLSQESVRELNEPKFSFMELLEIVNEEGDAWHSVINNQKAAQLACKFLEKRP